MIPKSNEIRVEVTTRCNYKCCICPRESLSRKIETMEYELFKSLIDKILSETKQYTTLAFPGMGEPFLDETLSEKIKYARQKGLNILILTNGSLLNVEKFKEMEALGVNSIRVSFYGNDRTSYSKVHGVKENMFDKVRNSLTEICKIRSKTQILMTYNVVDNYNDSVMDSWMDYWKGRVDLFEVWRPHNWVDGKNYRVVQQEKMKTCGRPFNTPLQIQVDGTVNMCCFDYNGKLLLGDLKTQTLNEIFNSTIYKKLTACHKTGDFKGSGLICENCDQRNVNKKDVMVYSSKFDIAERVNKVSTTYQNITANQG